MLLLSLDALPVRFHPLYLCFSHFFSTYKRKYTKSRMCARQYIFSELYFLQWQQFCNFSLIRLFVLFSACWLQHHLPVAKDLKNVIKCKNVFDWVPVAECFIYFLCNFFLFVSFVCVKPCLFFFVSPYQREPIRRIFNHTKTMVWQTHVLFLCFERCFDGVCLPHLGEIKTQVAQRSKKHEHFYSTFLSEKLLLMRFLLLFDGAWIVCVMFFSCFSLLSKKKTFLRSRNLQCTVSCDKIFIPMENSVKLKKHVVCKFKWIPHNTCFAF